MATIVAGVVISFTANWMLALIIVAVLPLMLLQGLLQTKFNKGFSADAKVCTLKQLQYFLTVTY